MNGVRQGIRIAARLLVCATLAFAPVAAHALALGKLKMRSGLDEPLNAEIELTAATPQELATLRAGIAPRDDFKKAGIERPPHLTLIKFTVEKRADGQAYLRLNSEQPVKEPFLHFLVEAEWTGGKLVREFTVLLDPPLYVKGSPPAITPPAPTPATKASRPPVRPDAVEVPRETPREAPVREIPVGEDLIGPPVVEEGDRVTFGVEGEEATVTPPAPPRAPAETAPTRPAQYGPTRAGDNAWTIANQVKRDTGLDMTQIMVALQRANPAAFQGNNVHRLKRGALLKLPEKQEIEAVPPKVAHKEYLAQLEAWQEYKLKLANAGQAVTVPGQAGAEAPAAPAKKAETPKASRTADAKTPPTVEKGKTAAPPAGTDGKAAENLLRIVRATLDGDKAKAGKGAPGGLTGTPKGTGPSAEEQALKNKATVLEEALSSMELENKELRERLKLLEKQIENANRLVTIENQSLAAAQQQAAERQRKEELPAEPVKPQAVKEAEAQPKAAPAEPAAPPPAPKPAPAKAPAPAPAQKDMLSTIIDELRANTTLPLVGGVIGALALVAVMVFIRRRRSIAEFEESILSGSALDTKSGNVDTGDTQRGADTSFLSDFGVPGMGTMHTDEVDPLAEAEVYQAYGRDEQAEEVLKDAIHKDPNRHELKLKLLEIYQQRNDLKSFETLAEELYPALGEVNPEIWERVTEMGRKLNPNNPLFSARPKGAAPAAMKVPTSPLHEREPFPKPEKHKALDVEVARPAPAGPSKQALEPFPEPEKDALELDLESLGWAEPEATAKAAPEGKDLGLDFDLSGMAAPAAQPGGAGKFDLEGMDLDLDLTKPAAPQADNGLVDFHGVELEPTQLAGARPASGAGKRAGGAEPAFDLSAPAQATENTFQSLLDQEAHFEPVGDLPGNGGGAGAGLGDETQHWDETATKLDLAKAYIDMGDAAGARGILDEVLVEGNEAQKKQAAELAAQLAR